MLNQICFSLKKKKHFNVHHFFFQIHENFDKQLINLNMSKLSILLYYTHGRHMILAM